MKIRMSLFVFRKSKQSKLKNNWRTWTVLKLHKTQITLLRLLRIIWHIWRSSHRRCSVKKGVLTNFAKFTGKHLWQSFFLNKIAGLWLFSSEFCKISKNTFSTEHLQTTAVFAPVLVTEFSDSLKLSRFRNTDI